MKAKVNNKRREDLFNNVSGLKVDISGTILDDELENLMSEDDENNFYSLGGHNHHIPAKDKNGRRVHNHPAFYMLTID